MASHNPVSLVLGCLFLGIFAFSASEWMSKDMLPPWLQAHLVRIKAAARTPAAGAMTESGPAAVLKMQLKNMDATKQPENAHALHSAIANVLRASGTQTKEAVQHLEAARDAAIDTKDPDTVLASRLELADAYIKEGRPLDSQREIAKASGVLANHFLEHRSKLNRGRGRAKFELGWTEQALDYFLEAEKQAETPADKVMAASDIARARTCLGQGKKVVEPLRQVLEVIHTARKAGAEAGMPEELFNELAGEIHLRLAEAFHTVKDTTFAKAHYTKALHLRQKSRSLKSEDIAAMKQTIADLERGFDAELHCPRLPRSPLDRAKDPPQNIKSDQFLVKLERLLAQKKYDAVESELKGELRKRERPYKGLDAATLLNMLGKLYRDRKDMVKAANQYRQALHAAIVTEPCCDAENQEARTAYEGLQDVKADLPAHDQRVAAAAISRYFDILNMKKSLARKESADVARSPSEKDASSEAMAIGTVVLES